MIAPIATTTAAGKSFPMEAKPAPRQNWLLARALQRPPAMYAECAPV
jgi:hypothetical protein